MYVYVTQIIDLYCRSELVLYDGNIINVAVVNGNRIYKAPDNKVEHNIKLTLRLRVYLMRVHIAFKCVLSLHVSVT